MAFSINENLAKEISGGALLSVKSGDKVNAMTVSWGGFGVLFGREVCFIFVRPSRFTYGMCEDEEKFTLTFFGEEYGNVLKYCGTKSFRDTDKIKDLSLSYKTDDGYVVFDGAKTTLKLKKIYCDFIKKDNFTDTFPLKNYKNGDFHKMYICQIV